MHATVGGSKRFWVDGVRHFQMSSHDAIHPMITDQTIAMAEWLKEHGPTTVLKLARQFGLTSLKVESRLTGMTWYCPVYQGDGEVGVL